MGLSMWIEWEERCEIIVFYKHANQCSSIESNVIIDVEVESGIGLNWIKVYHIENIDLMKKKVKNTSEIVRGQFSSFHDRSDRANE